MVQSALGPSNLYNHLVKHEDQASPDVSEDHVVKIVCELLNVDEADISEDVPLTSYGLESITASRLANALRPLISMTQIQLLGNIGIKDIRQRIVEKEANTSA
jgi:hypothetical protein